MSRNCISVEKSLELRLPAAMPRGFKESETFDPRYANLDRATYRGSKIRQRSLCFAHVHLLVAPRKSLAAAELAGA